MDGEAELNTRITAKTLTSLHCFQKGVLNERIKLIKSRFNSANIAPLLTQSRNEGYS
jgi:hypothetical protein